MLDLSLSLCIVLVLSSNSVYMLYVQAQLRPTSSQMPTGYDSLYLFSCLCKLIRGRARSFRWVLALGLPRWAVGLHLIRSSQRWAPSLVTSGCQRMPVPSSSCFQAAPLGRQVGRGCGDCKHCECQYADGRCPTHGCHTSVADAPERCWPRVWALRSSRSLTMLSRTTMTWT